MVAAARNVVQVALLAAAALSLFMASNLVDIPHIQMCGVSSLAEWLPSWPNGRSDSPVRFFCEYGDLIIWKTMLATLLFAGPSRGVLGARTIRVARRDPRLPFRIHPTAA
jgi:hypothetical protein